jgi:hypothetical protein
VIDLQTIAPWFSGLVALLALGVSLIGGRSKAVADKLTRHSIAIDNLETRCTKTEQEIEHLPSKDATHKIELGLVELRAEVRVIAERVEPISSIADRLQEFLLERAK